MALALLGLSNLSCEMNPMEEPMMAQPLENVLDGNATLRVGGSILYEETFEGSNPFSTAHGLETGASHSVTYVNRPDNSANKTSRFELRDNDPDVKGSRRVEVTIVKGEDGDIGKDTWYAFELYVPSDYINEEDEEVVNQWHQNGNASASIRIKNGRFLWRFYIDGKKVDTDLGLIQKNSWTSIVAHMVHSYGTDGVTQVWVNDKKIMDQKGRNINNEALPKWKIGIYKSAWASEKTTTSKRVLYFDNVRVGDQSATYEAMKTGFSTPSTPAPQPEPQPEVVPEPEVIPQPEPVLPQDPTSGKGETNMTYVNAQIDKDIKSFVNGSSIGIKSVGTHKISIRTNINPSNVASVKFELTGTKKHSYIDNTAPFALFGDDSKGNYYYGPGLSPGKYTLKTTTYTGKKGVGSIIGTQVVNFTVLN